MTGQPGDGQWLARWRRPDRSTAATVYCLPHAGASAGSAGAFARCAPTEWDVVAVRLPGRDVRLGEAPLRDLATATAGIVAAVRADADRAGGPVLLLGQCSGAVLAYEAARALAADPAIALAGLVAVSRPAPSVPVAVPDPAAGADEFLAGMVAAGAVPDLVLDSPELRELVLPALRGDIAMVAGYRRAADPPLAVPVTAVHGIDDGHCTAAEVAGWVEFGAPGGRFVEVPGGHLLLSQEPAAVAAVVAAAVTARG